MKKLTSRQAIYCSRATQWIFCNELPCLLEVFCRMYTELHMCSLVYIIGMVPVLAKWLNPAREFHHPTPPEDWYLNETGQKRSMLASDLVETLGNEASIADFSLRRKKEEVATPCKNYIKTKNRMQWFSNLMNPYFIHYRRCISKCLNWKKCTFPPPFKRAILKLMAVTGNKVGTGPRLAQCSSPS